MLTSSKTTKFVALIIFILLLASCSPQAEQNTAEESVPASSLPGDVESEQDVLNIYNWDTYIDPEILSNFEEQFNVTINYQIYESEEEMFDGLASSDVQYDLVVPSDYYLGNLRSKGMLTQLDKANIPNFKNLDPSFINNVYDAGNKYCAPYQWGTVGIGYNQLAVGTIKNWGDVFDPANAGRVGLYDDHRTTMELILLLLGYSPNTSSRDEIAEAAQYLIDRADIISFYHGDEGQDLLLEGDLDIVLEWSGDIFQVMEENDDIQYLVPPEGSVIWTDYICIPDGSQHKELAEAFINYLLEPEIGAMLSTYTQYGSPNKAAIPLLDEDTRNNPAIYPSEDIRDRLFPEADINAAAEEYYLEVWKEVLASVGQ